MGVVYNPDRNTLIPISTVSGEITYLTAGLIYEKMQSCLIIGTEVTYLKHYPDQDLYIADNSYMGIGSYTCIFSNRAQRDPYSYFHRWNPNTQEFVIRGGVSLNLSNATKNGIMYFYFPNNNAYTILSYDYNRLFFNNVEEIKVTIRVNYYLPDYDYTYAKITYKMNECPESVNDGAIVNLDLSQSFVNIEGLEEEKTYYFKIFTDKSESEAFTYTVEIDPVPPEYKQYIEKINGRIKDYEYFYWYDLEQYHPYGYDYIDGYKYVPLTSLSYYCDNVSSGANSRHYAALSKTAVYIVKEDDHYIASIDSNYIPQFDLAGKVTPGWAGRFTQYGYPNNTSDVNNVTRMYAWNSTELVNETPFSMRLRYGDLTTAFTDLSKRVKNIDIYVDGVLWSKAGK